MIFSVMLIQRTVFSKLVSTRLNLRPSTVYQNIAFTYTSGKFFMQVNTNISHKLLTFLMGLLLYVYACVYVSEYVHTYTVKHIQNTK